MLKLKLGQWYPAKHKIRQYFGEYWKGIMIKKETNETAVILNYRGSLKKHYEDNVDLEKGKIFYIGEGKTGNQKESFRNKNMISFKGTKKTIKVFLDCGKVNLDSKIYNSMGKSKDENRMSSTEKTEDSLTKKHLLYIGEWFVENYEYVKINRVYKYYFHLTPSEKEIVKLLKFIFGTQGKNKIFERELAHFAKVRNQIYIKHLNILRSRDSIAGEIGEYFSISHFNEINKEFPLIRMANSFKDIDAVQIKTGYRYAIKTIGKYPGTTSNIWSKDIVRYVDYFLITFLDPASLKPRFIISLSSKQLNKIGLYRDNYQKSFKIRVNKKIILISKFLHGDKKEFLSEDSK